MIKLEKIVKKGDIVSATVITVESNPETFNIVINVKTKEIVKNDRNYMDMYERMAFSKLLSLVDEYGDKLPKKAISAWF